MNTRRFYHTHNHDVIMFMYHVFQSHAVWEAMSEVYVHQDEQETTKKAPYGTYWRTHLLLHSTCRRYCWCICSDDWSNGRTLPTRNCLVLRRSSSFFRSAPPTCNELNPADATFSQSRFPSHGLCGLFSIIRPELMKPGIIRTGRCCFLLSDGMVFSYENYFFDNKRYLLSVSSVFWM